MTREATIELPADASRASDDGSARRTFPISFSSDEPYTRWWGVEILDHTQGAARLERLNAGAPVLDSHNRFSLRDQIGVVEDGTARLDQDGRGRAVIRLADDAEGEWVRRRIVDRIIKKVSVGYRVHAMRQEGTREINGEDVPVYRVTDWEPLEVTLTSVPADDSVGIGRSHEDLNMTRENTAGNDDRQHQPPAPAGSDPQPPVRITMDQDLSAARDAAAGEERTRIASIMQVMARYPDNRRVQTEGRRAVESGTPWEQFARRAMFEWTDDVSDSQPLSRAPTGLDLSGRELKQYSLFRAITGLAMQVIQGTPLDKVAPFEAECSRAVAELMQRDPRGIYVPYDVQARSPWSLDPAVRRRAFEERISMRAPPMSVGLASTEGAELVGSDHMANMFIEALRPATVVVDLGATVVDGLVGNPDFPKQTGRSAFTWVAEDGDATDDEVPIGQVTMTPHTVTGSVPITRRLLKQSSPSAESIVRNDLVLGAAEAFDLASIQGTGLSNQPLGVRGQTGVNTATIASAGAPTWAEVVAFFTAIASDNAVRPGLGWVVTPAVYGNLATTSKDSGSGRFLLENGQLFNFPVRWSTHQVANGLTLGGWSQVLIGLWGSLDLQVDRATKAASGGLVLRAFLDGDVAVRHGEAFCIEA